MRVSMLSCVKLKPSVAKPPLIDLSFEMQMKNAVFVALFMVCVEYSSILGKIEGISTFPSGSPALRLAGQAAS